MDIMDTELQESISTSEYINTGERTSSQVQRPEDVAVRSNDLGAAGLFGSQEAAELRARWEKIQIEFVDEPRKSVQQADDLVASVTQRLTEMFRDQKDRLEGEWGKGEVSTEELRTAFRRYRTLFDRLLSI
jgi:hypothetical protein